MTRTIVAAAPVSCCCRGSWNLHARQGKPDSTPMTALAERYVKTVLALGQHDKDYVDAYYGPPEWKREVEATKNNARRDRGAGGCGTQRSCQAPIGQRRAEPAPSSVSRPPALVPRGAHPHRQGREDDVRRGVEGALRRRRADVPGVALPEDPRYAREAIPGAGLACRALRRVAPALRDSAREARRRLPDRHQGLPRTDAQARHAAERRELHR